MQYGAGMRRMPATARKSAQQKRKGATLCQPETPNNGKRFPEKSPQENTSIAGFIRIAIFLRKKSQKKYKYPFTSSIFYISSFTLLSSFHYRFSLRIKKKSFLSLCSSYNYFRVRKALARLFLLILGFYPLRPFRPIGGPDLLKGPGEARRARRPSFSKRPGRGRTGPKGQIF